MKRKGKLAAKKKKIKELRFLNLSLYSFYKLIIFLFSLYPESATKVIINISATFIYTDICKVRVTFHKNAMCVKMYGLSFILI